MPLCGFNNRMIQGIAIFAEGLFEATASRAKENNVPVEDAFHAEIKEMQKFLEALENRHQELKRKYTPEEAMAKIVEWIDERGVV